MASQACSGDAAAAIVARTSATNARTTAVSRTNSSFIATDSDPTEVPIGRHRVRLTHPERVLFPEDGVTKGDLARYYLEVGDAIVPHLRERPFTLKRYPHGIHGQPYFHKQAPKGKPPWIPTRQFRTWPREGESRLVDFTLVNETAALVWMVQMNCIDMNAWYSRVDKPERPDFVLFDLDPSPDVGFSEVVQVALVVKQALDALGLAAFPKTSSAEGMHVLVPVERRYTYAQTREFCEIVAGALARNHRGLVTTEWSRAKRRGVLIDANQNGEGKTIASVYSVRPRPGAPVSARGIAPAPPRRLSAGRTSPRRSRAALGAAGSPGRC